jgi:hypothetical protein
MVSWQARTDMVRADTRYFWAQVKSKLGEPVNLQSELTRHTDKCQNLHAK